MANLLFDEKEFLPERDVVYEERRLRIEDQPASALGELLMASAFLAHPYGRPIIGWPSEIRGWTLQDLMEHYRRYYTPSNATLVVAGDIDRGAVMAKIRELFGPIPRGPDAPRQVIPQEPPQQGERRVFLRREAELPVVYAVHHVPNFSHPDSYALQVLAYILGGGESARLHRSLVYEKQLAAYAGADYDPAHIDPYVFGVSAGPLPGKTAEEVERAVATELERVQRELVSDRELAKAKNQIEAEFVFAQDSVHTLASLLGRYESAGGWRLLAGYVDGVRTVTAETCGGWPRRICRRITAPWGFWSPGGRPGRRLPDERGRVSLPRCGRGDAGAAPRGRETARIQGTLSAGLRVGRGRERLPRVAAPPDHSGARR
jgi:zinc protease